MRIIMLEAFFVSAKKIRGFRQVVGKDMYVERITKLLAADRCYLMQMMFYILNMFTCAIFLRLNADSDPWSASQIGRCHQTDKSD